MDSESSSTAAAVPLGAAQKQLKFRASSPPFREKKMGAAAVGFLVPRGLDTAGEATAMPSSFQGEHEIEAPVKERNCALNLCTERLLRPQSLPETKYRQGLSKIR